MAQSNFHNPFDLPPQDEEDSMINLKQQQNQRKKEKQLTQLYTQRQKYAKQINHDIEQLNPFKGQQGSFIDMSRKKVQYASIASQQLSNQKQFTEIKLQNEIQIPLQQQQNGQQPPLLEDIGIDIGKIIERMLMIAKMQKPSKQLMQDPDLGGPIVISMCFAFLIFLAGRMHFGDIYGIMVVGNLLVYLFINLFSQKQYITLYEVFSTMGYGMAPLLIFGFVKIILRSNFLGFSLMIGIICASLCGFSCMQMIIVLLKQDYNSEYNRKLLLGYPLFLFYVAFIVLCQF